MNKINNLSKITIGSCIVTTLIITPWVNVDSMIIPKLIMLALAAAYLLPSLLVIIKINLPNMNWILKSVLICVLLIIIQMTLVMFFTNSPLEQQFFGKISLQAIGQQYLNDEVAIQIAG